MTFKAEVGSFRDRNGQVFYHEGRVLRGISEGSLLDWETLIGTPCFQHLLDERSIVWTMRLSDTDPAVRSSNPRWEGYLEHERIPFVSYPYEWSFSMLRDAALQQLDLLMTILEYDMSLKDASAFNTQWLGTHPVFIDIPSIHRLSPGDPWAGYHQFCEMFLNPLLLVAYKGVDFQPWFRGSIDGIPVSELVKLMSWRDMFRSGVLKHVFLQSRLIARHQNSDLNVKMELKDAGFNKEMIRANVRGLQSLVERLSWSPDRSPWIGYDAENSYADSDYQRKIEFVSSVAEDVQPGLVWDLGCNTGRFSRAAARHAGYLIAMDSDHSTIDHLYQSLAADGPTNILPLVVNVAAPSPGVGWRLKERKPLATRGKPDLTLCLALLHHLVIGSNIPLPDVVDWFAELQTDLVIEFVTREDSMVQRLLRNKDDIYTDYDQNLFESLLAAHFTVLRKEQLGSGTRTLYFARHSSRNGASVGLA